MAPILLLAACIGVTEPPTRSHPLAHDEVPPFAQWRQVGDRSWSVHPPRDYVSQVLGAPMVATCEGYFAGGWWSCQAASGCVVARLTANGNNQITLNTDGCGATSPVDEVFVSDRLPGRRARFVNVHDGNYREALEPPG